MSGNEKNSRSELPFDVLLHAAASELPPPSQTVEQISPWEKAIKQILFGLVLNTVTLPFLSLNYILPILGAFLLLLGFRSLRRENHHFKIGYLFAISYAGIKFGGLVLNATIWRTLDPIAQILPLAAYATIVITLGIVICLRNGFVSVQRKANIPVDGGNATALIVWYIVLSLTGMLNTAVTEYVGTLRHSTLISACTLILLIVYACILISYYRQSMRDMDKSGYVIEPAPVKLSSQTFCLILCSILLISMVTGYLCFDQYPMDWAVVDDSEHTGLEVIKAKLQNLGFPDYLLEAMTKEDILSCEGAVLVDISSQERDLDHEHKLVSAIVSVKLSANHEWRFFHYFEWLDVPDIYRVDTLQVSPVYQYNDKFLPVGEVGEASGRLLYDKDGTTYSSDDYRYECTVSESNFLFSKALRISLTAGFSFPKGGEHYRGYLTYSAQQNNEHILLNTWSSYFHPRNQLQYPLIAVDLSPFSSTFYHVQHIGTLQDRDQE